MTSLAGAANQTATASVRACMQLSTRYPVLEPQQLHQVLQRKLTEGSQASFQDEVRPGYKSVIFRSRGAGSRCSITNDGANAYVTVDSWTPFTYLYPTGRKMRVESALNHEKFEVDEILEGEGSAQANVSANWNTRRGSWI